MYYSLTHYLYNKYFKGTTISAMPPLSDARAGHVSQVPVVTAPAAPDHRSRSRAQLLERLSVSSAGSSTSHQHSVQ